MLIIFFREVTRIPLYRKIYEHIWCCDRNSLGEIGEYHTVYPKKYAHGFCFAVLCCGYTLTDFPISIRLTSLALWQSNDCPSASKATLMSIDKYFMWIHYERLHNHNKAKHNKTVCIFLGIYCSRWCTGSLSCHIISSYDNETYFRAPHCFLTAVNINYFKSESL